MSSTIRNEALELLQQGRLAHPVIITEAHLIGLPEPVQRYLRYSQVVGKKTIRTVRLKQLGKMRQSAQPLMTINLQVNDQFPDIALPNHQHLLSTAISVSTVDI